MARSVRLTSAEVLALAPHAIALRQTGQSYPGTALRRATDKIEQANRVSTKARPKRKPSPFVAAKYAHPADVPKRERRAAETAGLWKRAMSRSGGFCECGCGRAFHEEGENKPEMDHEASRRVPQTIANVWMLALHCHRMRQGNRPSERYWLGVFLVHCLRHGYAQEAARVQARIDVVEVKGGLPASPRLGGAR